MQEIGEDRLDSTDCFDKQRRMANCNPTVCLNPAEKSDPAHFLYADNIGAFAVGASGRDVVSSSIASAQQALHKVGLLTHEVTEASNHELALGVCLDGERHSCEVSDARFTRLHGALQAFLRRRNISGSSLRVILGHCTFVSLVCQYFQYGLCLCNQARRIGGTSVGLLSR